MAARRRANRPAAAAPNSNTIGGAGTSWPPLELLVEPPLEEELEEDDELLDEELLDPEDVLPPKLEDEPLDPELPEEPVEPLLPDPP